MRSERRVRPEKLRARDPHYMTTAAAAAATALPPRSNSGTVLNSVQERRAEVGSRMDVGSRQSQSPLRTSLSAGRVKAEAERPPSEAPAAASTVGFSPAVRSPARAAAAAGPPAASDEPLRSSGIHIRQGGGTCNIYLPNQASPLANRWDLSATAPGVMANSSGSLNMSVGDAGALSPAQGVARYASLGEASALSSARTELAPSSAGAELLSPTASAAEQAGTAEKRDQGQATPLSQCCHAQPSVSTGHPDEESEHSIGGTACACASGATRGAERAPGNACSFEDEDCSVGGGALCAAEEATGQAAAAACAKVRSEEGPLQEYRERLVSIQA